MYIEVLTQGNVMYVQSILEICSIELDEAGSYTCNAIDGFTNDASTILVTVIDNSSESTRLNVCSYNIIIVLGYTYL